jgi:MFS family permease
MTESIVGEDTKKFAISLTGFKPGVSQEDLVTALQRLYPRQTAAQIRGALGRLPLLLARSATEEQARKLKHFLESRGAILKFIYSSQGVRPTPPAETAPVGSSAPPSSPRVAEKKPSLGSEKEGVYAGAERRVKPRVHPGIQLHPMGIGEILDRSFRLMRQHFLMFFFILVIPQATFFLVSKGMQISARGGVQQGAPVVMGIGLAVSFLLAVLVIMVLQFWAQGALIYAVSETYLGHKTSLGASYGAMRSLLGRLLGTMFLMGFLMTLAPAGLGIIMAVVVPMYAKGGAIGGGLIVISVLLGVVIFFNLLLNWLLVDKVVVLEGKGWRKALRRSKELMKARTEKGFWKSPKNKAGLILLLGFLIGVGIHFLFQLPGLLAQWLLPMSFTGQTIQQILNMIATSLAAVFTAIAMILYYYDIRLRSEGFDLKMMAEHL